MMTSGRSSFAASIAEAPSAASPTTSKPSLSSNTRAVLRKLGWSSTTSAVRTQQMVARQAPRRGTADPRISRNLLLRRQDELRGGKVKGDAETAQERVSEEAVVDDPLELHLALLLGELRRRGGANPAGEARERPDEPTACLVRALDAPHVFALECSAGLVGEALVQDQDVAAHVDLDGDRAPSRDRKRQEDRHRGPVTFDAHGQRHAFGSPLRERLRRLEDDCTARVVDGERTFRERREGEEPADVGEVWREGAQVQDPDLDLGLHDAAERDRGR